MEFRTRFLSAWNGIATLIFFAGIFLGFRIFGYSGLTVGLVMWITGGIIAGIIFGPKAKSRMTRRSSRRSRYINERSKSQFCMACGAELESGNEFCPECGTKVELSAK